MASQRFTRCNTLTIMKIDEGVTGSRCSAARNATCGKSRTLASFLGLTIGCAPTIIDISECRLLPSLTLDNRNLTAHSDCLA